MSDKPKDWYPRTAAEAQALREGTIFESQGAVWYEDDGVHTFTDGKGSWWVDKDKNGQWFKRRA